MTQKIYVGYDTREDIAWQVCKHSIEVNSPTAVVEPLKLAELREHGWYWRDVDKLGSTEFTFSRFLIPELMLGAQQRVLRVRGEAGIVDIGHAWVAFKERRNGERILIVFLHA